MTKCKNFVFVDPLLPLRAIGESRTHLQIAQSKALTKICKRVQFIYP